MGINDCFGFLRKLLIMHETRNETSVFCEAKKTNFLKVCKSKLRIWVNLNSYLNDTKWLRKCPLDQWRTSLQSWPVFPCWYPDSWSSVILLGIESHTMFPLQFRRLVLQRDSDSCNFTLMRRCVPTLTRESKSLGPLQHLQ